MSDHESNCLSTYEYLETGDYLSKTLDKKDYFLIQQTDGNLCWYKGTGPTDNQGLVWSSLSSGQETGQYFLIMQNDGNLCTYRGTGPSDNQGLVWESNSATGSTGDYSLMFALWYDDSKIESPALVVTKGTCVAPSLDDDVKPIWKKFA